MKKVLFLSVLSVLLCGCYGYSTTRTMTEGNKKCEYTLNKEGNSISGYSESNYTNERRSEKECAEWLKK